MNFDDIEDLTLEDARMIIQKLVLIITRQNNEIASLKETIDGFYRTRD